MAFPRHVVMFGHRAARPLALVGVGLCVSACAKPLLSPDNERSQFDRYDAVRSQYADQYTFDAFGRRQPNLRARLTPRQ